MAIDFDDQDLLRYSRQILLPELGVEGQARLAAAHALVLGLGGLGSPAVMYLAAAGLGRLTLVDFDRVDLSNLQRQIAHAHTDLGRPKVESAAERLRALNPRVAVATLAHALEGDALCAAVAVADVVLDCCDNFATRFALNQACFAAGKPLVSGSAIRWDGQVAVFAPGGPCYRCLYPDVDEIAETCTQTGVAAPLVGVIGSLQAVEALKLAAGFGEPLAGRLLRYDALRARLRVSRLARDPECPVCSGMGERG